MARDPYIEQRLENWGRWKAGQKAGGLGFATTNWSAFAAEDHDRASAPVLPDGEDELTDRAVKSLAQDQQDALHEQYVGGGSIEQKALRQGCHPKTYRARVDAGLRGVGRWLSERDAQLQLERERIEALQRRYAPDDEQARQPDKSYYLGGAWIGRHGGST